MKINRPEGYIEYCKTLFNLQQQLKNSKAEDIIKSDNKEDYPTFNLQPDNLIGEEWKKIELSGYTKYECSNKGRVKYNGKIVPQKNINEQMAGYLILDKEEYKKLYPDSTNSNMTQSEFVYSLIAKAWLGKIDNDGYHIHHVTNNGYDNSIENLVLLTAVEHSIVHGFKIGDW